MFALDGEEQDAYVLGVTKPLNEFEGVILAIIHRINDVEDKWIVALEDIAFMKEEIIKQLEFKNIFWFWNYN